MCGFQVSGVESGGAGFGWLYSLGCQVEVADSGCRSGVGCRARVGCRFRMEGCRDPQELPPMYVIVIANGLQEPLLLMYLYIYMYWYCSSHHCCCCRPGVLLLLLLLLQLLELLLLHPPNYTTTATLFIVLLYITIQKPEPLSPSIYKNLQTPSSPPEP